MRASPKNNVETVYDRRTAMSNKTTASLLREAVSGNNSGLTIDQYQYACRLNNYIPAVCQR